MGTGTKNGDDYDQGMVLLRIKWDGSVELKCNEEYMKTCLEWRQIWYLKVDMHVEQQVHRGPTGIPTKRENTT